MNYKTDPLLKTKKIILAKDTLNLYSALVKTEDFNSKRPLNSIPYLTGEIVKTIQPLVSDEIIVTLENYMQQYISKKTVSRWFKQNKIPFTLIRVLSMLDKSPLEKLSEYIYNIDYVTNNAKNTKLKLLKSYAGLLNDKIIYFYGYLLGDGCISQDKYFKFCDGHQNKKYLNHSLIFLNSFQNFVNNKFNTYSKITKIKNHVELVLVSKYLSRFFKFFYGFKKHKGIVRKPKLIMKDTKKIALFYRGFFDADAGIKVKDKFLNLKCKDEKFMRTCKSDLKNYGISTSEIEYDNHNTPYFKIYSHNLLYFAKSIGFNHPRKQRDLINHLKKGCQLKQLDSVNKRNLIEEKIYNLSKIKGLRVGGAYKIFKQSRKNLGTQKKVASLLNTYRENIKRWENNEASIPFSYYFQLMELNGLKLKETLNILLKKDVSYSKGNMQKLVKLPFIFEESHFELFKYLTPLKSKVIVKSYGLNNRKINRKEIYSKIEELFDIKVVKNSNSFALLNTLIPAFLRTFFVYKNSWDALSDEETRKLNEKWNIF